MVIVTEENTGSKKETERSQKKKYDFDSIMKGRSPGKVQKLSAGVN